MQTEHRKLSRTIEIPGIGKRERTHTDIGFPEEGVPFQVAETLEEVMNLIPGDNQEEKNKNVLDLLNSARWAEERAKLSAKLAGTGRKSAISTVKRTIKMLRDVNPDMSEAALAHTVITLPGITEALESEGLTVEDVQKAAAESEEKAEEPAA